MKRVVGFVVSYGEWARMGFPRREPEWVGELMAICRECEAYEPDGRTVLGDVGLCGACGCHVSDDAYNDRNKLVLPNTSCPLGKWGSAIDKGDG